MWNHIVVFKNKTLCETDLNRLSQTNEWALGIGRCFKTVLRPPLMIGLLKRATEALVLFSAHLFLTLAQISLFLKRPWPVPDISLVPNMDALKMTLTCSWHPSSLTSCHERDASFHQHHQVFFSRLTLCASFFLEQIFFEITRESLSGSWGERESNNIAQYCE